MTTNPEEPHIADDWDHVAKARIAVLDAVATLRLELSTFNKKRAIEDGSDKLSVTDLIKHVNMVSRYRR